MEIEDDGEENRTKLTDWLTNQKKTEIINNKTRRFGFPGRFDDE